MLCYAMQQAERGFRNARLVPCSLRARAASIVLQIGDGERLRFRRADESALWLVDPSNRGQLLSPAACASYLQRLGIRKEQQPDWMGAVEPAEVWARMCRNLENYHRQDDRKARFWRHASHGLGGVHSSRERR